jgi:hypothetical protein
VERPSAVFVFAGWREANREGRKEDAKEREVILEGRYGCLSDGFFSRAPGGQAYVGFFVQAPATTS